MEEKMIVADITWNGPAVTHRVGGVFFRLNRVEPVEDESLVAYCESTKGFTVNRRPPVAAKPAPKAAPAKTVASEPDDEPPVDSFTERVPEEEPKTMPRGRGRGRKSKG
jgi:type IV secretory pathway ATPase VirB11/archaellum biosynthesis ATPase